MTDRPRIHAVLVSYLPGPEVTEVIAAASPGLDRLWIIDNGSTDDDLLRLRAVAEADPDRIRLIANGANIGLASAQNRGLAAALSAAADWVLLLDQDSVAAPDMIDRLLEALTAIPSPDRVGILAPALIHRDHAKPQRYLDREGRWLPLESAISPPLGFVIASGSLIRATALRAVGGMADALFIDYVDVEFGLRLNGGGWTIHGIAAARLGHRLGAPTERRLFGRRWIVTNHSARRRFTIYRNRVLLWRALGRRFPAWLRFDMVAAVVDVARVVLLERDRPAKLAAVARGLAAGLFSPLAKTLRPGSLADIGHTGSSPMAAPSAPPRPDR